MISWPKARLDDCCRIVSGATPSTTVAAYWDGDIPWATPKDLSELASPYLEDTPRKITKQGLEHCAAEILPAGSVLFSSRAPIGHVALNRMPTATNQGFKSFVPDAAKLDSKFLFHWLRTNRFYLESLGNGATFKELSKATISRVEIPLPPVEEQRRIAAILDQAEALRARRRQALQTVDKLPGAIFIARFGDQRHASLHRTAVLGDVADVVSGVAKGRKFNGDSPIRVPYLRVANVQAGFLDLSEIKTIEALPREVAELRLKPGDVVLTEGGDLDKLGRGAILTTEIGDCIHQNHVFRVRVDPSVLHPQFFHEYLQTDVVRAYFLRCAKRTTNLASINMTQLRALPVPLPALGLQQEFADQVAATERVKTSQRASLAKLDALFASLQHRAFRGEL